MSVLLAMAAAGTASTDDEVHTGSVTATYLPGSSVAGKFVLLERIRSLPSTMVPVPAVHRPPPTQSAAKDPDSKGLELFGSASALEPYLVPELLLLGEENHTSASAEASHSPGHLALPPPFELELALAEMDSSYRLRRRVHGTSHGEVWRAVRADDPNTPLILKRLRLDHSAEGHGGYLRAGLRERHFGGRLRGVQRIARFLDAFERDDSLWLVFRDEGCAPPPPPPSHGCSQHAVASPSRLTPISAPLLPLPFALPPSNRYRQDELARPALHVQRLFERRVRHHAPLCCLAEASPAGGPVHAKTHPETDVRGSL